MSSIVNINKRKIYKAVVRSIVIFLLLILIVFSILYFVKQQLPSFNLIISILIGGASLIGGLTFLSFIFWKWAYNRKYRIFEKLNLASIGFTDKEINHSSFWKFNDIIKTKEVENYTINLDISQTHGDHIEIKVPLKWRQVDRHEFELLEHELKSQKIELGIECIIKLFKIKVLLKDGNSIKLDKDILEFIKLIKLKGFDPDQ